jgi:hypothetical protein
MRGPIAGTVVTGVLFLGFTGITAAEDEPPEMVTDRPDATESTSVVPPGFAQFEIGWTHAEDNQDGVETKGDSFPEALARIGVGGRFELRLGFDGYRWEKVQTEDAGESDTDAFGNTSVGLKVGLVDEKGARPALALLAAAGIPSGSEELAGAHVVPSFRMAFANTLTERLSLGYNLGVQWFEEENESGQTRTVSEGIWSVSLGIGVNGKLSTFVELYGSPLLSSRGSPANVLDGGFTFLLRRNVQLDGFVGAGLSSAAPDWIAGLGLSLRVPR